MAFLTSTLEKRRGLGWGPGNLSLLFVCRVRENSSGLLGNENRKEYGPYFQSQKLGYNSVKNNEWIYRNEGGVYIGVVLDSLVHRRSQDQEVKRSQAIVKILDLPSGRILHPSKSWVWGGAGNKNLVTFEVQAKEKDFHCIFMMLIDRSGKVVLIIQVMYTVIYLSKYVNKLKVAVMIEDFLSFCYHQCS